MSRHGYGSVIYSVVDVFVTKQCTGWPKRLFHMHMENTTQYVPTLTPTFEQWRSLALYLTHHETRLQRRYGAVKILPPSRWISLTKNPYELRQIKLYVKQKIIRSSHLTEVFYIQNTEIIKRRVMSYEDFKTLAESDTYRLNDAADDKITEHFWSTLPHSKPLCVPNIEDSLFAKRETIFNMAHLPSLLSYYPNAISGRSGETSLNARSNDKRGESTRYNRFIF